MLNVGRPRSPLDNSVPLQARGAEDQVFRPFLICGPLCKKSYFFFTATLNVWLTAAPSSGVPVTVTA